MAQKVGFAGIAEWQVISFIMKVTTDVGIKTGIAWIEFYASYQHSKGSMRHRCNEHEIGYSWQIIEEPKTAKKNSLKFIDTGGFLFINKLMT